MLASLIAQPSNGLTPYVADEVFSEISRFFNGNASGSSRAKLFPLDLIERSDHYLLKAALPGISKDSIEIIAEGNVLSIRVSENRAEERRDEDSTTKYIHRECYFGSQSRKIVLPENANSEAIEGSLKDGVLEVKIQKKEESVPKRITIT